MNSRSNHLIALLFSDWSVSSDSVLRLFWGWRLHHGGGQSDPDHDDEIGHQDNVGHAHNDLLLQHHFIIIIVVEMPPRPKIRGIMNTDHAIAKLAMSSLVAARSSTGFGLRTSAMERTPSGRRSPTDAGVTAYMSCFKSKQQNNTSAPRRQSVSPEIPICS